MTSIPVKTAKRSVVVDGFTNSILDPDEPMLGPLQSGGTIIANTAPGCWGPMITPRLRGGHEVTKPVYIEGAEVGDGIVIRIRDITVTSLATASGNDSVSNVYCLGDPFVAAKCPTCDEIWPETHIEGVGQDSVRCNKCGNPIKPFHMEHGYTVVFAERRMWVLHSIRQPLSVLPRTQTIMLRFPINRFSIPSSIMLRQIWSVQLCVCVHF